MSDKNENNATFYCFKGWSRSRKFYTSDRGHVSKDVFAPDGNYLEKILIENEGRWPGLSGPGNDYYRFVVIDGSVDHGWPLMFDPTT